MKKLLLGIALIVLCTAVFASCGTKGTGGDNDSAKPPETSGVEGFEDVTAPPEDSESGDSSADSTDNTDSSDQGSAQGADQTGDGQDFTSADALKAAKDWLGESDPDTGYKYAYSFDEMLTDNGTEYFKIRVSWYLEDEDRYSLCGYLLVSPDGKSVQKYNW